MKPGQKKWLAAGASSWPIYDASSKCESACIMCKFIYASLRVDIRKSDSELAHKPRATTSPDAATPPGGRYIAARAGPHKIRLQDPGRRAPNSAHSSFRVTARDWPRSARQSVRVDDFFFWPELRAWPNSAVSAIWEGRAREPGHGLSVCGRGLLGPLRGASLPTRRPGRFGARHLACQRLSRSTLHVQRRRRTMRGPSARLCGGPHCVLKLVALGIAA
jgi:hypothetical protein